VVAPELLGKLIVHGGRIARLVEVEAYAGPADPASHAFKGPTPRTAAMFGPAGHLYVYFSYGVHWCANVVTGAEGEGSAVLLRAAEAVAGLDEMRADRPTAKKDADLLRGPGNLTKALAITKNHYAADLTTPEGVHLRDDGYKPEALSAGPRVGITKAVDNPWRWWITENPAVSGPRRPRPGSARPTAG
jgi:DNA-3-methyladenine glycosylase